MNEYQTDLNVEGYVSGQTYLNLRVPVKAPNYIGFKLPARYKVLLTRDDGNPSSITYHVYNHLYNKGLISGTDIWSCDSETWRPRDDNGGSTPYSKLMDDRMYDFWSIRDWCTSSEQIGIQAKTKWENETYSETILSPGDYCYISFVDSLDDAPTTLQASIVSDGVKLRWGDSRL